MRGTTLDTGSAPTRNPRTHQPPQPTPPSRSTALSPLTVRSANPPDGRVIDSTRRDGGLPAAPAIAAAEHGAEVALGAKVAEPGVLRVVREHSRCHGGLRRSGGRRLTDSGRGECTRYRRGRWAIHTGRDNEGRWSLRFSYEGDGV